jgi:tRNA modification GTPase
LSTIAAIATAPGGAIGIIRVSGTEAINIVNSIFSKDILDAKGYSLHYGQITNTSPLGEIERGPQPIDDVLVSVFRSPHSYTGEDSIEISCHGSRYILETILSLLIEKGCLLAQPGEFTQRAFLNGKMDLTQAEAVADLIASSNASQHRIAINQMRGGITSRLHELRDKLLHLTSLLELELDFSDHEELEFADRSELEDVALTIKQEITKLLKSFSAGNAIKNGIPVAIIGAPNVGKSTLLNALLGDDRAIVSDIQGTTRDLIEDTITIEGRLFRFIDTAGIRHTDDTIENLGIERSLKAAKKARIIILMRDDEHDYPELPSFDLRPLTFDQHPCVVIKIHNKSDHFQALNGIGIDELKQKLVYSAPSNDDAVVVNQRHKEALTMALTDIQRAIAALKQGLSGDLVSEDLRLCIQHLADILGGEGTITTPEVLANIFKHFCVGK